jgi:hypothetical protein
VPVERLAQRVWRLMGPVPEPHHAAAVPAEPAPSALDGALARAENVLSAWGTAALLVLLTAVAVALLALA